MRKEKLNELRGYMEELKMVKFEPIHNPSKSFITVEQNRYFLNNGHDFVRAEIKKNKLDGSAAIILPVTNENNVILVVEPRVLTASGIGVGFPAGYIDKNENPKDGALRELREETGYVPKRLITLAKYYQDEGVSRAYNHSFLALDCEKQFEQSLDGDEFIKYFECTYEESFELMDMGYITGANTIIALERSKPYMKEKLK